MAKKNIGENSDMPSSLTVTSSSSSALELRSDYQNLVEKAEKAVSESRSNLTDDNTMSKFIEQENRKIKSLSSEDIESLETRTGDTFGGLAKKTSRIKWLFGAATCIGFRKELGLITVQKENIIIIYNDMKREA